MNYKTVNNCDQVQNSQFDSDLFNASLMMYYISKNYFSINPQWNKIVQSPYFKTYNNIVNPCDLFQTDFPAYLVLILNDYFQKKSKSNYFSSFFSRNDNQSQIDSICEASAFITEISQDIPDVLLSDQFISQLIHICLHSRGFAALMSLKTLSNIAENTFESSQLLLSKEILPDIFNLALSSNDKQIKHQAMFLISSFAKFDHGEEIANAIFTFFFNSEQITTDLLNISLRAFALLSSHHNNIFNQSTLIQKIYDFIQPKCDIVNLECFSIFINIIHLNSEAIDIMSELGIFQKVFDILKINYSSYCIDFMIEVLIKTRNYDNIICNQDFISIYDFYLEKESNKNKSQIINLITISLLNSSTDILSCICNSSIFSYVFELLSSLEIDDSLSKTAIIGTARALKLLENDYLNDFRQEFCEIINSVPLTDDKELNCVISNFLESNDPQNS